MKKSILFLIIILPFLLYPQENPKNKNSEGYYPVPFTQKDRELLIDLKVQGAELKVQANELKEEVNELKSDMKDLLYLGIAGFAAVIGLIAIIYWDRRTFAKPLETKVAQLEIKTETFEKHFETSENFWKALRELARQNEQLKKILQQYHLI